MDDKKIRISIFNVRNKKYNLIKIGHSFVAAIGVSLILSGCVNQISSDINNIKNNNYKGSGMTQSSSNSETTTSGSSNSETTTSGTSSLDENKSGSSNYNSYDIVLTQDIKKIVDSSIKIDLINSRNFINEINSIEVNYLHSELYGINQSLNKYYSMPNYISSSKNVFVSKKISAEKLYYIVLENNKQENFKNSEIISDDTLLKICEIMSNLINSKTVNMNDNELKNLSEKILNLKIHKFTEFSNGYYDPVANRMGFAIDYISSKSVEFFKNVIEHETFHLIQANTLEELDKINDLKTRFGPCVIYNDVTVNSLYWNWFYEGAAEYLMLNYNNKKESTNYQNNIKHFDTIKVATILNSTNSVEEFENLSLNGSLDSIFEYFGCKTQEQKNEIIKMMFSSDIILQVNHSDALDEFYALYEKTNGKKMTIIDKRAYEKELKGSVSTTLSKIFYTNLANEISNKQVSVKEIFSYISIFESELNRFCWYNTSSNYSTLSYFFGDYINIQSNFFEILSKKLNITVDEVHQAYDCFNKYYKLDVNELTLLSSDKKQFYNNIIETRKNYKTNSINYVYNNYINIQKEK